MVNITEDVGFALNLVDHIWFISIDSILFNKIDLGINPLVSFR